MLEIRGVKKHFGDTRALDGLDLDAHPGEILGIAGPNGAGKSTLIKLLAGEETLGAGAILLNGEPWSGRTAAGRVAVVHQEPQLFPNLTVAQNLLVGREGTRLDRPRASAHEAGILGELEIARYANASLGRLPLAIQQRTEIARALAREAQLFLFDEPNSALTEEESVELFRRMHGLAEGGRIVLLVSHRVAELVAHAKRVAVIRDGRCTALLEGAALTQEALAHELVVEEHAEGKGPAAAATAAADREGLVRISGWTHPRGAFLVPQLAFARGEIVAIVGVEGSGAREFVASLAGYAPAHGSIEIAGHSGPRGLRALTAYIAASRRESVFPNFSVAENIVSRLGVGEIAHSSRYLRRRRIFSIAEEARRAFRVHCTSVHQSVRALSGGNQQKVAIAAAMRRRPALLVAEEPTRGVDIGSKAEIYHLLREFAGAGNGVVMYCTEVPEVFEIADRALVMDQGRLSDPLDVHAYTSVRQLAADVSALERHARAESAPAA